MFKKEISFISDLNLNKLQVLGERLSIKDINQSKLHPALIKYINSAIDKEIFLDRKKIEVNTVFDYSGDRINNYFSLISEEIKRTQNFDLKFIKQILQNAVLFNVNYLSKPNRTLINFVFGVHEVKAIDEIIINVSHAYYYRYLQKILFTYFEKKKTVLMRRDEFASLLNRIDQISKETHLEDTLITAINSMANFFDTGAQGSEKLPLPAIKFYLQEKRFPEFVTKLEEKFGIDNNSLVLVGDVAGIVLSVTPESEILVEETEQVEDELVEDKSANSPVSDDVFEQNNIEEIQEIKEEPTEIKNSEPTELVDDENEIPSEDILIEEDRNDDEFLEGENVQEELETDLNDPLEDKENDIEFEEVDEKNDSTKIKEEKKKPEVKALLRKLINLDRLYDSFIKFPKPFTADKPEELELSEISSMISRATNYQIDLSTLAEEIENPRETVKETIDSYYMSPDIIEEEKEITKISLSHELTKEEIFSEEKMDELNSEIKDINESIDEIVADDLSEKEFEEEIVDIEIVDADNDEIQSMENLIDEKSLALNEEDGEEVTEVFSDLTYLDQKEVAEIDLGINEEENVQEESEEIQPLVNDLDSENEIEKYQKFSDILVSKDMTRIIESIFDYDMEDYHSMINSISGAANETQAIEFAEEYFRINHIETTSNEVLEFKSFISEYFAKAYS
jgi:hypothetical protein